MIIRKVIDLDCTDDAGPSSSVDVEVVYVSSGCESDSDSITARPFGHFCKRQLRSGVVNCVITVL